MSNEVSTTSGPKVAKNPSTIEMIKEAVRDIKEPRKGCSVPAIKQWVASHYPEVDQARFKPLMKKALQKLLDEEYLERPASSTATGTMTGRYKIGKAQKDADKKAEKAAAKAERSRAPKAAVNKKLMRRSLSVGSTPKAKKSRSKTHIVPARRAISMSPGNTPKKSPKVTKKKSPVAKKKAKKSPAAKKTTKAKAKSPKVVKAKAKTAKKSPAAKGKAKKPAAKKAKK